MSRKADRREFLKSGLVATVATVAASPLVNPGFVPGSGSSGWESCGKTQGRGLDGRLGFS